MLCRMFVSRFLALTTTCPGTGEDRAEGASFWYAFLTPFWGPKNIFFFKRNDAEAYVWPKSDTRQAQQKVRLNVDKTKTYKIKEDTIKHWVASKAMVLCMARPGRGRARPQNLSFCTWRGPSEAGEAHHIVRIGL